MAEETTELLTSLNTKRLFSQTTGWFRFGYYSIVCFQIVALIFLVLGQTFSLIAYDWTVRQGLQEGEDMIGPSMVQMNKSIAAADTILYLPLIITSTYGLIRKLRWSLICTAASASLHSYWSLLTMFEYVLLPKVSEWTYRPQALPLVAVAFFVLYGISVLTFEYVHWDLLLEVMD